MDTADEIATVEGLADLAYTLQFDAWRERVCDPSTPEHLVAMLCEPIAPVPHVDFVAPRSGSVGQPTPVKHKRKPRVCIGCDQLLAASHFYSHSLRCRPCQHQFRHEPRQCATCRRERPPAAFASIGQATCRKCHQWARRKKQRVRDEAAGIVRDPVAAKRLERNAARALERAAARETVIGRAAAGEVATPRPDVVRKARVAPVIAPPAGATPFSAAARAHRLSLIGKVAPGLSDAAVTCAVRRRHCVGCRRVRLASQFRPAYRVCEDCVVHGQVDAVKSQAAPGRAPERPPKSAPAHANPLR